MVRMGVRIAIRGFRHSRGGCSVRAVSSNPSIQARVWFGSVVSSDLSIQARVRFGRFPGDPSIQAKVRFGSFERPFDSGEGSVRAVSSDPTIQARVRFGQFRAILRFRRRFGSGSFERPFDSGEGSVRAVSGQSFDSGEGSVRAVSSNPSIQAKVQFGRFRAILRFRRRFGSGGCSILLEISYICWDLSAKSRLMSEKSPIFSTLLQIFGNYVRSFD